MALILAQGQLFVLLFILLQFSTFLSAFQGTIELQSSHHIKSPTVLKETPVPLLLFATSDVKIRRKLTPTPSLLAPPVTFQTPSPIMMIKNMKSSIVLKRIVQLSPIPVLTKKTLPTAARLTSKVNRAITTSKEIPKHQTSMRVFVSMSLNDKATHAQEVSSIIKIPIPQKLTGKISKTSLPHPDLMTSVMSTSRIKSDINIHSLLPSIDSFQLFKKVLSSEPTKMQTATRLLPSIDSFQLFKKVMSFEPTKIQTDTRLFDTISFKKSNTLMSIISPTQTINQSSIKFATAKSSITSIERSSIPELLKKLLISETTTLPEEKPSTKRSLKAIFPNQMITNPLFLNISSLPVPLYVTIILSPTIILSSTNTPSTISPTLLSSNSVPGLSSPIQNSIQISQNKNMNIMLHSDIALGLAPSKSNTLTDAMIQVTIPTPTLTNNPGELFELKTKMDTRIPEPSLTASPLKLKPILVSTDNLVAIVKPSPDFIQKPNIQNNHQLPQVLNPQPHFSPLIQNRNLNNFVLPIQNNTIPGQPSISKIINESNNSIKLIVSLGNTTNKTGSTLNLIPNTTLMIEAIILPNPQNRSQVIPTLRTNSFIQVPNIQNNHQLLQVVNQQPYFSHLIQNANLNNFRLPIVLPIKNNNIPGQSSISKRINEPSNFLKQTVSQGNTFSLPNKTIPSLNLFSNNTSSRIIFIKLNVTQGNTTNNTVPSLNLFPNTTSRVQAIFLPNPLLRSQVRPNISPSSSFTKGPNILNNPQLLQVVNRQLNVSPLIQNGNLNRFRLPIVLPKQINNISSQSSISKRVNEPNNFIKQTVSLGNTSSVPNKPIPSINSSPNNAPMIPAISVSNSLLRSQFPSSIPLVHFPSSAQQNNSHLLKKSLPNQTFTFIPLFPLLPIGSNPLNSRRPNATKILTTNSDLTNSTT